MNKAYNAITLEWLNKARSDFLFAEESFKELSGFYSQITVLCHDAAEKFLKAFLIAQGKRPERIHDLLALLNECLLNDPTLHVISAQCGILNEYYIPLKYPSHYPEITKEQAEEAVTVTREIRDEIEKRLSSASRD